MVEIDTSNGPASVKYIAEGTWAAALTLLSIDSHDQLRSGVRRAVRQEIGELIVQLANVVALAGAGAPFLRIDIQDCADGDPPTMTLYRYGEQISNEKCASLPSATVTAVAAFWEHCLCGRPEAEKRIMSQAFQMPLVNLLRVMIITAAAPESEIVNVLHEYSRREKSDAVSPAKE